MKAKQSAEKKILSPTARALVKQAKQEERERIIKILSDMEKNMGEVCNDSEGLMGCDEANLVKWVREDLIKFLESESNA